MRALVMPPLVNSKCRKSSVYRRFNPGSAGTVLKSSRSGTGCLSTGRYEVELLLEAALSDWINFLFVPAPEQFVMYADHDEYTTFYTGAKSSLDRIAGDLSAKGFARVSDYERHL